MLHYFTGSSYIGLLLHMYSFMPQLPEQFSSAIKPGPVTLVNGIQWALGDKVLLQLTVASKTTTSNIKEQ